MNTEVVLSSIVTFLATAILGMGLRWLANKVNSINARLDAMNGKIAQHFQDDIGLQTKLAIDIAYLRGRMGESSEGKDKRP